MVLIFSSFWQNCSCEFYLEGSEYTIYFSLQLQHETTTNRLGYLPHTFLIRFVQYECDCGCSSWSGKQSHYWTTSACARLEKSCTQQHILKCLQRICFTSFHLCLLCSVNDILGSNSIGLICCGFVVQHLAMIRYCGVGVKNSCTTFHKKSTTNPKRI